MRVEMDDRTGAEVWSLPRVARLARHLFDDPCREFDVRGSGT